MKSFSDQFFSESLDRVKIGENTIIMTFVIIAIACGVTAFVCIFYKQDKELTRLRDEENK